MQFSLTWYHVNLQHSTFTLFGPRLNILDKMIKFIYMRLKRLLNTHDQDLTFNSLVYIWEQSILESWGGWGTFADRKERNMMVSKLIEWLDSLLRASGCWRTHIQMSREQQELDKELRVVGLLWQDPRAKEEIFVSLYLSAGFPEVNFRGLCGTDCWAFMVI